MSRKDLRDSFLAAASRVEELREENGRLREFQTELLYSIKRHLAENARLRSLLPELIDTAKLLRGLLILAGEKADIFELTSPSHKVTLNVPEVMERLEAIIAEAEKEGSANE